MSKERELLERWINNQRQIYKQGKLAKETKELLTQPEPETEKLHIATSPLTNTIFAGVLSCDGVTWANKQDVTTWALVAVAEHAIAAGKPIVVTSNGQKYEIIARDLEKNNDS